VRLRTGHKRAESCSYYETNARRGKREEPALWWTLRRLARALKHFAPNGLRSSSVLRECKSSPRPDRPSARPRGHPLLFSADNYADRTSPRDTCSGIIPRVRLQRKAGRPMIMQRVEQITTLRLEHIDSRDKFILRSRIA